MLTTVSLARTANPVCHRILLADDNGLLRTAVQGMIGLLGHLAEAVSNGREAVEQAARVEYDIIFLDLQMPEMGGIEAASMLRRGRTEGRPWLIALSADDGGVVDHRAAGLDDFVAKPIRMDDLRRIFRRYDSRGRGRDPT
ncbi:response regulator [Tundrisphaera lichenicola]|uniref:response regulator n=1 Tax=Tundrisphaera lichenicola TaxID=2029860 RepID=UPI003EBAA42A